MQSDAIHIPVFNLKLEDADRPFDRFVRATRFAFFRDPFPPWTAVYVAVHADMLDSDGAVRVYFQGMALLKYDRGRLKHGMNCGVCRFLQTTCSSTTHLHAQ